MEKKQKITLVNHHPKLAISLPYLKKNVSKILSLLKLKDAGVEITLVADSFMRGQNQKFMNKKGTTDVLSFPHLDVSPVRRGNAKVFDKKFLGDILISLDQAQRQAKEQSISLVKEVNFLIVHSMLHLIGYDHGIKKERLEMQKLESKIFGKLYRMKRRKKHHSHCEER